MHKPRARCLHPAYWRGSLSRRKISSTAHSNWKMQQRTLSRSKEKTPRKSKHARNVQEIQARGVQTNVTHRAISNKIRTIFSDSPRHLDVMVDAWTDKIDAIMHEYRRASAIYEQVCILTFTLKKVVRHSVATACKEENKHATAHREWAQRTCLRLDVW